MDNFERFKDAAGSWKDVPESFVKETYLDRMVAEARAEYFAGKTKVFDNVEDLMEDLEN